MSEISNKIPYGYCHCGCGKKTKLAPQTHSKYGWVKNKHLKFLQFHHIKLFKKNNKDLKYYPANKNNKRLHVIAVEKAFGKAFGKALPKISRIHHVNCDHRNFKNNNLVLCQDDAYHRLLHLRTTALLKSGNANNRHCVFCQQWDDINNLTQMKTRSTCYHKKCNNLYHIKRRQKKRDME